jgi:hypothetical protein
MAEMELRGSDAMRSRLVGALAAIALVAAIAMDVGVARADTMPIHRGLPDAGYGEPDDSGEIHGLAVWTRMTGPSAADLPSEFGALVTEWIAARLVQYRPYPLNRSLQLKRAPRGVR